MLRASKTKSKQKAVFAIVLLLLLAISAMTASIMSSVSAITYTRETAAFASVAPKVIGLNQALTVNLWVYPPPSGPHFAGGKVLIGFDNFTVTFTRPDGTKDTFMPTDGSGSGLLPGQAESVGTMWFLYYPSQVGTWSLQFSYPGKTFDDQPSTNDTAVYTAATSQTISFTVQKDPVNAGLLTGQPIVPLPTDYWTRPINTDNREWSQISGDWLMQMYDATGSDYNPYTTAPNTAHIVWKTQVSNSGIIGGAWGSLSYPANGGVGGGGGSPFVIITGRVFINKAGGVFDCYDLRTGQLLYEKPGTISIGQHLRLAPVFGGVTTPQSQTAGVTPYQWETSGTAWKQYDPWTGALLSTISNVPAGVSAKWFDGDPVIYAIRQTNWNTTIPNRLQQNELLKWDLTKVTGANWPTGIVWNTSLKQADGTGPGEGGRGSSILISGDIICVRSSGEDFYYGYNATTGKQIYVKQLPFPPESAGWLDNGAWLAWDSAKMVLHAIDIRTGVDLWQTQIGEYPWGSNNMVVVAKANAYGMLYTGAYDGYMYAINITNGALVWKTHVMSTNETIYGEYPLYNFPGPIVADGKVYMGTTEHSPTQPRFRGNMYLCFDAYSGKILWNVSGALGSKAIADGYLLASNENDGFAYCFGKGQTETTVTVQNDVISKGSTMLIKGTVMDQSPAQPNTPAVSDDSMTEWMNYMQMQKPMPTNVQGVQVVLTATAPDGSTVDIGQTTSDGYGYFQFSWTPPSTGNYKIQATFAGSQSYWSSTAETGITVTAATLTSPSVTSPTTSQAPSETSTPNQSASPSASASASTTASATASPSVAPPPSTEAAPSMTLYVALAVAAAVIVVAAVAVVLRRRK